MKSFIYYLLKYSLYIFYYYRKKKRITFIPHPGMSVYDGYNIINWKSDNALTLANYVLSNAFQTGMIISIIVSSKDDISVLKKYVAINFPQSVIDFIVFNPLESCISLKQKIKFYISLMDSKYVFTSITLKLRPFCMSSKTKYIDLGYFPMPFKNDLFSADSKIYMGMDEFDERDLDFYICNSELAIRLIMTTMNIPYKNFLNLGNCRNDYLISEEYPLEFRKDILKKVSYPVNTIILYTPTHRDYEYSLDSSASRNLFGYNIDLTSLAEMLKEEGIMIICKIHPKQNKAVLKTALPEGICVFEKNEKYGLSELMKVSDALITDYTSGYFDYLLLDKPVIFNFYDVDKYQVTRGFTFNPIEAVCAGEIVKDREAFIHAIKSTNINASMYQEKRKFVRNLVYSYLDTLSTKRIYSCFFS